MRGAPEVHSRDAKVRIAGRERGAVKRVERGPGTSRHDHARDQGRRPAAPPRRELKIRPRTFLEGNFFVDLKPGTPGAPVMEEGGTIPVANTAVAGPARPRGSRPAARHAGGTEPARRTRGAQGHGREPAHRAGRGRGGGATGGAAALPRPALRELRPGRRGGAGRAAGRPGGRRGHRPGAWPRSPRATSSSPTCSQASTAPQGARLPPASSSAARCAELDALLSEARPALAELNELFPRARAFAAELRPGVRALAPETLRLALPFLDQAGALLRPSELPRAARRRRTPRSPSLARLERPLAQHARPL